MRKPLTTNLLISRILRWNLGNTLIGLLLLCWALLLWWVTLVLLGAVLVNIQEIEPFARYLREPRTDQGRQELDGEGDGRRFTDQGEKATPVWKGVHGVSTLPATWYGRLLPPMRRFAVVFLLLFVLLGFRAYRILRFAVDAEGDAETAEGDEDPAPTVGRVGAYLFLALPVIAPICTFWSFRYFGNMILPLPGRVRAARKAYRLLCAAGGWQAYPSLRSQRLAVKLLARLGYVRISKRFGKWEVKANPVAGGDEA